MASSKGEWESRVRDLIRPKTSFYHKCADRPAAGRARLDFTGITLKGMGFLIEVKQAPERVRTQDWLSWKPKSDATTLSELQRMELTSAVNNGAKNVLVLVGIGNILYRFGFNRMEHSYGKSSPWPLIEAYPYYWTGPKGWKELEWIWEDE